MHKSAILVGCQLPHDKMYRSTVTLKDTYGLNDSEYPVQSSVTHGGVDWLRAAKQPWSLPWNEYKKCVVMDQTAKKTHDPRRGLGHTWWRMLVMPSSGRRKSSDLNDFLQSHNVCII